VKKGGTIETSKAPAQESTVPEAHFAEKVVMIAQPKTGVIGECGNWQGFALIHIL
jgi:hypothetical protein